MYSDVDAIHYAITEGGMKRSVHEVKQVYAACSIPIAQGDIDMMATGVPFMYRSGVEAKKIIAPISSFKCFSGIQTLQHDQITEI